MLWLRAYARKERWREESILVPFEMECTVRYFERKAEDWERWRLNSATPGHDAYAARQADMWRRLANHASNSFAHIQAVMKL